MTKQLRKENPENFDEGLTRVAPKGEFKAMNKKQLRKETEFNLSEKLTIGGFRDDDWFNEILTRKERK